MIGWFQRKMLIRKGLACDKKRRKFDVTGWRETTEKSVVLRVLLCALYALFIFLCGTWRHNHVTPPLLLLLTFLVSSALLFLHLDLPEIWQSNSKLSLIFGSLCLNLLMIRGLYIWSNSEHLTALSDITEVVFLVPMVFAPPLLSVLLGTRAGLYAVVVASLTDSLLLDRSFPLLLISLGTGFTAVFFTRHVRRRSNMIRAGMAVGVASFICTMTYGFVSGYTQRPDVLFQQALLCGFVGIVTAILVNSLLPIIEYLFGINTEIAWVELTDLNHPLLRQMSLEAPGTYHHSLAVANLAEAAAVAIGANGTLCRVMAYFHDIGKIPKPGYFSENAGGTSPHDQITPQMSALVIAAHVKEGVDLALKYRLKKSMIDAIQQHHGDSLIYYFFRRAQQLVEDAKAGSEIMNLPQEDVPEVAEQTFRYPGPRPQTREIGLLMLADSIEGASRSLEKPTPQRIEELVNDIINHKVQDHQLDECPISFQEIRTAAESFTFTLKTMMHSRISYPKHATNTHPTQLLQQTKRMHAPLEEARNLSPNRA